MVELPERNCGTTGVARVLTGNISKSSNQSLVNGDRYSSRTNTASSASASSASMNARR